MPKFTDLPAASAAHTTDLLAKVDDPSGVPISQKLTVAQLATLLQTSFSLITLSGGLISLAANGSATLASGLTVFSATGGLTLTDGLGVGGATTVFQADGSASIANGHVSISTAGDIEIDDNTANVIIKSPDGTRYRIKVANGGALSTVPA